MLFNLKSTCFTRKIIIITENLLFYYFLMRKITHINIWTTTVLTSVLLLNKFSFILLLYPFLAILADADHGKDSLSSKGLTLPWKHRGWSHSIFGTFVLWTILLFLLNIILWFASWFDLVISTLFITWTIAVISLIGTFGIIWIVLYITSLYLLLKYDYILPIQFFAYLLIFSHLLWDYFTKTWIPLFYPISNKRFNSFLHVSTWWKAEEILNLFITIVNIWLIYYIINYTNILQNLIDYQSTNKQYTLVVILSLVVVFYFLWKDLNIKNIIRKSKRNLWKVIKDISLIIIYLLTIIVSILNFSLYSIPLIVIALVLLFFQWRKTFENMLNLWEVSAYLLVILILWYIWYISVI